MKTLEDKIIKIGKIGATVFLAGLLTLAIGSKTDRDYLVKAGALTYGLGTGAVIAAAYGDRRINSKKTKQ